MKLGLLLAAPLALLASLAASAPAPVPMNRQWPSVSQGPHEQRFSPRTAINTGNVAGLGLAWYADMPSVYGLQSTPIYADGVLYATSAFSVVHAYSVATGKELWAVQTTPRDKPYSISGAPRIAAGLVIIGKGGAEFGVRGYAAIAGGGGPDLRHSTTLHGGFEEIVRGGSLASRGMVSFAERITADDAEAIRSYLVFRANEDRNRPDLVGATAGK